MGHLASVAGHMCVCVCVRVCVRVDILSKIIISIFMKMLLNKTYIWFTFWCIPQFAQQRKLLLFDVAPGLNSHGSMIRLNGAEVQRKLLSNWMNNLHMNFLTTTKSQISMNGGRFRPEIYWISIHIMTGWNYFVHFLSLVGVC